MTTYSFILRTKNIGKFSIGAAKVIYDKGKSFLTSPYVIVVNKGFAHSPNAHQNTIQPPSFNNNLVFLTAELSSRIAISMSGSKSLSIIKFIHRLMCKNANSSTNQITSVFIRKR